MFSLSLRGIWCPKSLNRNWKELYTIPVELGVCLSGVSRTGEFQLTATSTKSSRQKSEPTLWSIPNTLRRASTDPPILWSLRMDMPSKYHRELKWFWWHDIGLTYPSISWIVKCVSFTQSISKHNFAPLC